MAISKQKRQTVNDRARKRCEYCQAQRILIMDLEVEHVYPTSRGGNDDLENLCLACFGCNNSKSDFVTGVDPLTNEVNPLYNPRAQIWTDHFMWSADGLNVIGITSIGRATVIRLKLNREVAITAPEYWVQAGLHPPK